MEKIQDLQLSDNEDYTVFCSSNSTHQPSLYYQVYDSELYGIALNNDWLLKLGFKRVLSNDIVYANGDLYLQPNSVKTFTAILRCKYKDSQQRKCTKFTTLPRKVKSVHQLQLLYASIFGKQLQKI